MSGGLTHSSAATAGTESSSFAAKGYQVLQVASLALDSQKPMGQDSAAQVLVELLDDEVWEWVPGIAHDLILKLEPIVLDDFVEDRLFRLVPGIGE